MQSLGKLPGHALASLPTWPRTSGKPSLVAKISQKLPMLLCGVHPGMVFMFARLLGAPGLALELPHPLALLSTPQGKTPTVIWAAQAG